MIFNTKLRMWKYFLTDTWGIYVVKYKKNEVTGHGINHFYWPLMSVNKGTIRTYFTNIQKCEFVYANAFQ